MRQLIINADDFGLTAGVNRAIVELHRAGSLTSATLMAKAAATDEAVELAWASPSLGVGCHVVLVDGESVMSPRLIPSLADALTGQLPPTLGALMQRVMLGRIPAYEIETEVTAQIERLQAKGIALTHIDTHKHAHMFPAMLRPVLRAAAGCGIRVVRNPFEPAWSLHATRGTPIIRRMQVSLLRRLHSTFRRIVAEEGFTTTNGSIGVLATGTLNAATIGALLKKLPQGRWELVTHPGYNDADLAKARTRLLASRETEREALASVCNRNDIELIHFSHLRST